MHFFDNDTNYNKGINSYEKHFNNIPATMKKGEFTPRYMLYLQSLVRIKRHYPNVKIIISLRNPVDRAFSQYRYFRFNKKKEPERNFNDALVGFYKEDYLTKSLYHNQLINVFNLFPSENIYICIQEKITKDPKKHIKDLYNFLGVDDGFTPKILEKRINKSSSELDTPGRLSDWSNLILSNKRQRRVEGVKYGKKISLFKIWIAWLCKLIVRIVHLFTKNRRTPKVNKNNMILPVEQKKAIFNKYFKEEVDILEKLLNKDLSIWKVE